MILLQLSIFEYYMNITFAIAANSFHFRLVVAQGSLRYRGCFAGTPDQNTWKLEMQSALNWTINQSKTDLGGTRTGSTQITSPFLLPLHHTYSLIPLLSSEGLFLVVQADSPIISICSTAAGLLLVGSDDGKVYMWKDSETSVHQTLDLSITDCVSCIVYYKDNKW